ncbi:hypothetical protein JTB14_026202 [Gonioctena quinquepunctata]|nr:hypothetical protein JTB14_026202 [Gonioctena quinquepunctata]
MCIDLDFENSNLWFDIQTISDSEGEQQEPKPELKEEPPDTENISETEETPENQQETFSAEHIEQEFRTFINLYQTKWTGQKC